MTLAGSITYGPSDSINLNAAGCRIMHYVPNAAALSEEYVTETVSVELTGANELALGTLVGKFNSALRRAYDYSQTLVGSPVYFYYQPDGYSAAWRSEIVARPGEGEAGRFQLAADAQDNYTWSENHTIRGDLIVTRRNFWEGPTDIQVPLTNGNGTGNTTGLNVYNCSDGVGASPNKRHNYFDVAGTAITGDLPAPAKVQIILGGDYTAGRFILINNVNSAGTAYHWHEGEGASFAHSDVADASRSAGSVASLPTNGTAQYYWWQLDADYIGEFGGNYVHCLASLKSSAPVTYKFKTYLLLSALQEQPGPTTLWNPAGTASYYNVDLGVVRIPASYNQDYSYFTSAFGFDVASSSPATLYIDSLQTAPIDYHADLKLTALGLNTNNVFIADEITRNYYAVVANTKRGDAMKRGPGLYLAPGRNQRIYLRMGVITTDADLAATAYGAVKLWYRPRRLSL